MRSSYHTIYRGARRPMLAALAAAALFGTGAPSTAWAEFTVEEATIEGIHDAIKSGEITCKGLVQAYIDRAKAYNGVCTQLVTSRRRTDSRRDGHDARRCAASIPDEDHRRVELACRTSTSTRACRSSSAEWKPPHRIRASSSSTAWSPASPTPANSTRSKR